MAAYDDLSHSRRSCTLAITQTTITTLRSTLMASELNQSIYRCTDWNNQCIRPTDQIRRWVVRLSRQKQCQRLVSSSGQLPSAACSNGQWMARLVKDDVIQLDRQTLLKSNVCHLFSPLGKLAERAIYFTFRNFFFFYYEQSYLSIYCTDFHELFTKWKVFAWIFLIWSSFSDSSRDVAMVTNLVAKWGKITYSLHLSLCNSETE